MSTNIWITTGRLTADPEVGTTPRGTPITTLRLAVDRDAEDTDFFTVAAFGATAEAMGTHLVKGRLISIEATLRQNTWTDADGHPRSKIDIIVNRFHFLDAKPAATPAGVGAVAEPF